MEVKEIIKTAVQNLQTDNLAGFRQGISDVLATKIQAKIDIMRNSVMETSPDVARTNALHPTKKVGDDENKKDYKKSKDKASNPEQGVKDDQSDDESTSLSKQKRKIPYVVSV